MNKPHPVPYSNHSASGYRNVYTDKQTGKHFVMFRINGRKLRLGTFDTIEAAVDARQQFLRTFYPQ